MVIRRLQPYFTNVDNRLVNTFRVCIRDSGIAHALLNPKSLDDLLGYPVVGSSWEAYATENLIGLAPPGTDLFFYRSQAGAGIDLLLLLPNRSARDVNHGKKSPKFNWDCTICRSGRIWG